MTNNEALSMIDYCAKYHRLCRSYADLQAEYDKLQAELARMESMYDSSVERYARSQYDLDKLRKDFNAMCLKNHELMQK